MMEFPPLGCDESPGSHAPWMRGQVDRLDLEHHRVLGGQDVLWVLKDQYVTKMTLNNNYFSFV